MPRLKVDVSEVPWVFKRQAKDRVIDDAGYVYLWDEASRRYVGEHRLVAARALGRPLRTAEQVHHIDGRKWNNLNSNLLVCDSDYHEYLDYLMRAARYIVTRRPARAKLEERRARLWLNSRRAQGELSSRRRKTLLRWGVSLPPTLSSIPKPAGS